MHSSFDRGVFKKKPLFHHYRKQKLTEAIHLGSEGRGGTPIKSGWVCGVCVAKGLKPWPYLKMNQSKIDALSKAWTRKKTPYAMEEQKLKIAWSGQIYFLSVRYLEVNIKHIIVDQLTTLITCHRTHGKSFQNFFPLLWLCFGTEQNKVIMASLYNYNCQQHLVVSNS